MGLFLPYFQNLDFRKLSCFMGFFKDLRTCWLTDYPAQAHIKKLELNNDEIIINYNFAFASFASDLTPAGKENCHACWYTAQSRRP